jgi:hypothetical protein
MWIRILNKLRLLEFLDDTAMTKTGEHGAPEE